VYQCINEIFAAQSGRVGKSTIFFVGRSRIIIVGVASCGHRVENMKYNPEIHHRQSIRLREFDYSQSGAYFVTICTKNKECLFGEIKDGEMGLNEFGGIVHMEWLQTAVIRENVELDVFVVMPNHFHGIILLSNTDCRGEVTSPNKMGSCNHVQGGGTPPLRKYTLGQIIAYFKYQSTKQINQIRNNPGVPVWQRNYYERIIRNQTELDKIREYVLENPMNWLNDENYKM
jgi:putative transposase